MQRIEKLISDIQYVADSLRFANELLESGNCNDCLKSKKKGLCEFVPEPGQLARYNCPFYLEEHKQTVGEMNEL